MKILHRINLRMSREVEVPDDLWNRSSYGPPKEEFSTAWTVVKEEVIENA